MSGILEKGLVDKLDSICGVHPKLPQPPTFPAIRYQRIYTNRVVSVDGENVGPTEVGMQVDCMGETYQSAKDTADAVRAILHTYSGQWGESTSPVTHLTAHFVNLQTENDFFEQDGDKSTHWVSQRYQIWTDMD